MHGPQNVKITATCFGW